MVGINDTRVDRLWIPSYRQDIAKFIRKGVNELELHVFSSMANRFIGLPDSDLAALRRQFGNRFPAPQEMEIIKGPEHAGIEGQVRIAFSERESPSNP